MVRPEVFTDYGRLARVYLKRVKAHDGRRRRASRDQQAMRSCIIMGSGRSGTSMLAGSFSGLGYFMGDSLYIPARDANPKGFFEDQEINLINEALIAQALPGANLAAGHGWLASVPLGTRITPRKSLARRMAAQTARAPFCFKDPRFCYTLSAWRPYLDHVALVCVFREPARTANSIVKECHDAAYLAGADVDFDKAVSIWTLMYRHVLDHHRREGRWVFVHYDQIFDGSAASRLTEALGVTVNPDFPEPSLRRSPPTGAVGSHANEVYRELCEAAEFQA